MISFLKDTLTNFLHVLQKHAEKNSTVQLSFQGKIRGHTKTCKRFDLKKRSKFSCTCLVPTARLQWKEEKSPKPGQIHAPCLKLWQKLIPQESCHSADGGDVLAPSEINSSSFIQLPFDYESGFNPCTRALDTMLIILIAQKGFAMWYFTILLKIFLLHVFARPCKLKKRTFKPEDSPAFLHVGEFRISHTHRNPQTIKLTHSFAKRGMCGWHF